MSSIAAGTTTGSALVSTGDTTGELVLKTNGTTTAVTIDTSQNVTITGNVLPATDNTGVVGNATNTWSNGQFTNLTVDSTLNVRAAIDLADNDILRLGSSDDWEMFHNGTANYMDLNVGDLLIRDNTTTRFTLERTTGNVTIAGDLTVNGSIVGAAGSFIFLSTADFSNTATADFTLPAGYDAYQFVWGNVIPATDNVDLYLRTSTDGGANYDLTAYDGVRLSADTSAASVTVTDITTASGAALAIDVGSAGGEDGISGIFTIFYPHIIKNTYFTWHFGSHNSVGRQEIIIGSGIKDAAEDVDAVRFLFSAGNIESGTITLYGMKNS